MKKRYLENIAIYLIFTIASIGVLFLSFIDITLKVSNVFYCAPEASWQRGAIEKNYEYIRYVLPKGSSFDELTQEKTNLLMSNINCTSRDTLNGETKWMYLLDELLEINDFGLYSQGIVKMVVRKITKKAKRKIKEELEKRIAEPKAIVKKKEEIRYIGTVRILENITEEYTKENIKNILKPKKCSELILIN